MTTPATPSNRKPGGDDRNLVAVDPATAASLEDKLHLTWKHNRQLVLGLVAFVLVVILGKSGWDYMARQKELDLEKEYATATTNDQLKAFAAAHPNHSLGAIAQLRVADDAFTAGKFADALAGYEKAVGVLKDGPLVARAQIGRALAKVQTGKTADGTSELKQIAADTAQLKVVRTEAAYDLASLAATAGNIAEAQKYCDQVQQIDTNPMSNPWLARAMQLRMTLPATPAPSAPAASALTLPSAPTKSDGAAKKDESPKVEVKLPGSK